MLVLLQDDTETVVCALLLECLVSNSVLELLLNGD